MTPLFDGLRNLVAGLGTSRDKSVGAEYGFTIGLTDAEITAAYRGAPLAKKIVDIPALDSVREWREWQANAGQIGKIEQEEKRLKLQATVSRAKRLARLRGGAAILIGTGDNDVSQPLNLNRITTGGIKYLAVMSRRELVHGEFQTDPRIEGYGDPIDFQMTAGSATHLHIHPSRLVVFRGEELPDDSAIIGNDWWGDSILQSTLDAVKDTDATFANILSLIYEAKVDVVKIPQFTKNLREQGKPYEDAMVKRWTLAMTGKGVNGALMIDKDEEYEQKSASFGSLDALTDRFMIRLAAAADIPATRLWGMSPAGMNATGESDLRNYYDRIKTHQTIDMDPALHILNECLIRSALGNRPAEIFYNWRPLWQPSAKEQAEVADKITSSFERVHRMDVLPSDILGKAVVNAMTEAGVAAGLEADAAEFYEGEGSEEPNATEIVGDAAPRTLYVSRKVLNADAILKWAKSQGFKTTLPADDLHVTIAYSRKPVDWLKMGDSYHETVKVDEGGARLMENFGFACVLVFGSNTLIWRHEDMKRVGATWDHEEYQPHITISYAPDSPDLSGVEPYTGEIILGPEIFKEIDEGWAEGIKEA